MLQKLTDGNTTFVVCASEVVGDTERRFKPVLTQADLSFLCLAGVVRRELIRRKFCADTKGPL